MATDSKQPITIKPEMIRGLAVYEPPEGISEQDLKRVLARIAEQTVTVRALQPKGVFFSFKNILEISKELLKAVVDTLDTLSKDIKTPTGVVNYTSAIFQSLEDLTFNTSLILAKNLKIAALFLETIRLNKHDNILIYDEDKEAASILYSDFISHGASVVLAKDKRDFKSKAQTNQFAFKIFDSRRNDKSISVSSGFKMGYYFYNFKGYLNDSLIKDFELDLHKHRLREGFKAFLFDFSKVTSLNSRALSFILQVAKETSEEKGHIYIHSINKEKLDEKTIKHLSQSNTIKIYGSLEECFRHAEAKGYIIRTRDLGDKTQIALSKEAITKITIYVKTILEVLKTYGLDPKEKKISKPGVSSISNIKRDNIGIISFDGDLNATVMLFFTDKQVEFISHTIFGAATANSDEKKDLIAEVLNTVGGQIKLVTSNMDIPISISLPEAFLKHEDLLSFIDERKGVLVETTFHNEPLEVFFIGSVLLKVL